MKSATLATADTFPPAHHEAKTTAELCEDLISNNPICLFGNCQCEYTQNALKFFNRLGTPFEQIFLDHRGPSDRSIDHYLNSSSLTLTLADDGEAMKAYLMQKTSYDKTPFIFINGDFVGGFEGSICSSKNPLPLSLIRSSPPPRLQTLRKKNYKVN